MHRFTESENGYLSIPRMNNHSQILTRILDASQGDTVAVYGPKGSGKRSFLKKLFRDNNLEGFFIDESEIMADGRLDADRFTKTMRSTVSLEIRENLKIVEGEVTLITYDRLQLKTRDMESVFNIGIRMRRELERERVCIGDIIKIYKESCFITRLGRSLDNPVSTKTDLLPRIPLPEGECIKTENVISNLTLDEIDLINSNKNGEANLYADFLVDKYTRDEVDRKVQVLLKESKAVLERRALVVYCRGFLSVEDFESILSPTTFRPSIFLIFDTTAEIHHTLGWLKTKIICLDFSEYSKDEIEEIVLYFCSEFNIELNKSTIDLFVKIAQERGLGYARDMMRASIKGQNITENDVLTVRNIFD